MATTASPSPSRVRCRPVLSVAVTLAAIGLLMTIGSAVAADRLPDAVGHGLSHLFVGGPLAWLLTAALRSWPPARAIAPGRLGRRVALVGLAGVVTGQVLEVVGARVGEPSASAVEELAHTAGMVVTTLSMLVLVVGCVLALAAATRDGAVPRWVAAIVAVVIVVAFAAMVVGAPGA